MTRNLRRATLKVSGPGVEGTFFLDSIAPPRYPGGEIYPSPTANLALAPSIYWNVAIPAGTARANFMLGGSKFELNSVGGHDRNWGPFIWDNVAEHWYWTRIIVGPYIAVFWTFTSAIDGQTYVSAFLSENEVEIFATRNGTLRDGSYATQTLVYDQEGPCLEVLPIHRLVLRWTLWMTGGADISRSRTGMSSSRHLRRPTMSIVGLSIQRQVERWEERCGVVWRTASRTSLRLLSQYLEIDQRLGSNHIGGEKIGFG